MLHIKHDPLNVGSASLHSVALGQQVRLNYTGQANEQHMQRSLTFHIDYIREFTGSELWNLSLENSWLQLRDQVDHALTFV